MASEQQQLAQQLQQQLEQQQPEVEHVRENTDGNAAAAAADAAATAAAPSASDEVVDHQDEVAALTEEQEWAQLIAEADAERERARSALSNMKRSDRAGIPKRFKASGMSHEQIASTLAQEFQEAKQRLVQLREQRQTGNTLQQVKQNTDLIPKILSILLGEPQPIPENADVSSLLRCERIQQRVHANRCQQLAEVAKSTITDRRQFLEDLRARRRANAKQEKELRDKVHDCESELFDKTGEMSDAKSDWELAKMKLKTASKSKDDEASKQRQKLKRKVDNAKDVFDHQKKHRADAAQALRKAKKSLADFRQGPKNKSTEAARNTALLRTLPKDTPAAAPAVVASDSHSDALSDTEAEKKDKEEVANDGDKQGDEMVADNEPQSSFSVQLIDLQTNAHSEARPIYEKLMQRKFDEDVELISVYDSHCGIASARGVCGLYYQRPGLYNGRSHYQQVKMALSCGRSHYQTACKTSLVCSSLYVHWDNGCWRIGKLLPGQACLAMCESGASKPYLAQRWMLQAE